MESQATSEKVCEAVQCLVGLKTYKVVCANRSEARSATVDDPSASKSRSVRSCFLENLGQCLLLFVRLRTLTSKQDNHFYAIRVGPVSQLLLFVDVICRLVTSTSTSRWTSGSKTSGTGSSRSNGTSSR